MELRVLNYFMRVAQEGSFTKAAEYLHVTQPTLSRQIALLEEELNQELFVRKSHHVELTEAGRILKQRSEEIPALVSKTEDEIRGVDKDIRGVVEIGSGETQAIRSLVKVIRQMQEEYPNISYNFYSGNSEDVLDRLDKGLLDFGVLIHPADFSKLNALELPDKDTWGVVMRKDSELAKELAIRKEDLLDRPLILSRQALDQNLTYNEFAHWFGEDFGQLNIVSTFNLFYNAAILVEEGVGYAITLDKLVNTTANSMLTFRPLEPSLQSAVSLVWKPGKIFTQPAAIFLERVIQSAK